MKSVPLPYIKITSDRLSFFRELIKIGCNRGGYTSIEKIEIEYGWPDDMFEYVYVDLYKGIRAFRDPKKQASVICMNDKKSFIRYVKRHILNNVTPNNKPDDIW